MNGCDGEIRLLRLLLLRIMLVAAFLAVPHDCFGRTWRDATGEYSTEAKFVLLIDELVTLRKADDSVITVPWDRLSKADQDYLRTRSVEPVDSGVNRTLFTMPSSATASHGPTLSEFVDSIPGTTAAICYLLLVVGTSLWAFLAYGLDKLLAQNGSRRISEKNLLFISFLGGWPGAFAAQRMFRHKTQKVSFQTAFWTTVVFHFVLVGIAAFLIWK